MKKSILSLSLAFLALGATTSCEDMLTPDMDRFATEFTGTDSINFYLGIIGNMQGMVEQNVLLGDLRSDLVSPTEFVADSVSEIVNFSNLEDGESSLLNRAAYYKVINQCNYYLAKVDSMAKKNDNYFMRRELSQVELIRAWTYMQLVQNYGKVPFITRPVDNAGTGWEKNPAEGWADADNLIELLEGVPGQSLRQACAYLKAYGVDKDAHNYGYPNYGNFNNGAVPFAHSLFLFNANLVMGDLYLLRGRNKQDYAMAAAYYHEYLEKDCPSYVTDRVGVSKTVKASEEATFTTNSSWGNGKFSGVNWTATGGEVRTAIPSAANSFFGKVLTSIPEVYGFKVSSRANTNTSVNGEGEEQVSTSGSMTVSADYKMRQIEPSASYEALNRNQIIVRPDLNAGIQLGVDYVTHLPDARFDVTAPLVRTDAGRLRFVSKFCGGGSGDGSIVYPSFFSFRYGIPLYRTRQIYLKYAEAINRAGFPRHAFAILRDGLEPDKIPTINSDVRYASAPDTVWTRKPQTIDETDPGVIESVSLVYQTIADSAFEKFTNGGNEYYILGANCIDLNELYRAKDLNWLDFSKFSSKKNIGIHQAGCGLFTNMDLETSYETVVGKRIEQEKERSGRELLNEGAYITTVPEEFDQHEGKRGTNKFTVYTKVESYDVYGPSAAEISAVETLIADEMALELAFEGTRYYDLMRIARHRNQAGEDGSAWMAWLISRRDYNFAPYEQPNVYDANLYSKLIDPANWYLPAPKNN